jgi:hypothetical protein
MLGFVSSNPRLVTVIAHPFLFILRIARLLTINFYRVGCDVSRLRDFIVGFYTHSGTPQTPDDAFCAFVWSLVVQQPTVRVGTIPPGVTSEVWIAPQISAKRKAKEKGEEHIETKPTELDLVPDAKKKTLEDLKQEYGDKLRIALDSDAIYAAITGSHIRVRPVILLKPTPLTAMLLVPKIEPHGIFRAPDYYPW